MITWRTALVLGRVSNLPTVWTNAIAGLALAGGAPGPADTALLLLALSLFYSGGMYLNDAFDAEIDRRERANRPIPRGLVSERLVWVLGATQMTLALVLASALGVATGFAALALGAAIIAYDAWHKRTKLSPLLMGLCRLLVYITAATTVASTPTVPLVLGAIGLFCYVVGLTFAAKQEAYDRLAAVWPLAVLAVPLAYTATWLSSDPLAVVLWLVLLCWMGFALRLLFRRQQGDVPRAVVSLIAGMALYDAVLVAGTGAIGLAIICTGGFALTIALQRIVPGT